MTTRGILNNKRLSDLLTYSFHIIHKPYKTASWCHPRITNLETKQETPTINYLNTCSFINLNSTRVFNSYWLLDNSTTIVVRTSSHKSCYVDRVFKDIKLLYVHICHVLAPALTKGCST